MPKSNVSYDIKRFSGIKRDYKEEEVEMIDKLMKKECIYE